MKDYIPKGVLGIEEGDDSDSDEAKESKEQLEKERVEAEVKKLEEELADLEVNDEGRTAQTNGVHENGVDEDEDIDEDG